MQGLELPAPPLLAETDLPSACEQPLSPPTPPGPIHQFPEPEDTTGQARRRATAGSGHHVYPRVLCSVLSASLPGTISVITTTATPNSCPIPTITTATPVYNPKNNHYIMVCIIIYVQEVQHNVEVETSMLSVKCVLCMQVCLKLICRKCISNFTVAFGAQAAAGGSCCCWFGPASTSAAEA